MTSFDRRASLSLAIHEPMIASVAPSAFLPLPDGIGYCSAVSTRLTPASVATSSIAWHISSSGELKSVPPQRCVPSPSSLTMMSLPPSGLVRMPPASPFCCMAAKPALPHTPGRAVACAEGGVAVWKTASRVWKAAADSASSANSIVSGLVGVTELAGSARVLVAHVLKVRASCLSRGKKKRPSSSCINHFFPLSGS